MIEKIATAPKLNSILPTLLNALLFQIGWFSCVMGGNTIAIAVTAIILYVHHKLAINNLNEWLFIFTVASIGLTIDSLLSVSGILLFDSVSIGIPIWLFCIWLVFSCTLNHSLKWLSKHLLLAMLMGAIAGPMSYFAGAQLTDVSLATPQIYSLIILACIWATLLPLLMLFTRRLPVRQPYIFQSKQQ